MWEYSARLLQVVDGDTLKLAIDLGFRVQFVATCRLARLDCPEIATIAGVQARLFVAQTLSDARALKIKSHRLDKYGRALVELEFQQGDKHTAWVNLNDLLLQTSHARPYKH
jgi:endonuclease YncB( thermonuclease family)